MQQRCDAWDLLSPQCLTLPSLILVLVAVALAGDEEQGDEYLEPFVEEGPDDVVTMTLKREASIHQRDLSRRWELKLSSQLSPLAPALLPRRRGPEGLLWGFLQRKGWEPLCLLPSPAGMGQKNLVLPLLTLVCHGLTLWSSLELCCWLVLLWPQGL